jgi:precorrin-2 dehydrogenase/sirohydrochlorin ferrochelatase
MAYYPVFLDLTERYCVVIGGGSVGERKAEGLLQSGARVTVISPRLSERLEAWRKQGAVQHVEREYQRGDLNGCDLAFTTTDDPAVNEKIYQDAREQKIWLNVADDPAHCDFVLPALIRRGALTVGISTGGASPAATRAVREELETYLTEDFAGLIQIASEVRRELREQSIDASPACWNKALRGDFRQLIAEGRVREAKKLLLEALGAKS